MKPQKNVEVQRLPKAEDVCLTSVNKGKYMTSLKCYVNRKYMLWKEMLQSSSMTKQLYGMKQCTIYDGK